MLQSVLFPAIRVKQITAGSLPISVVLMGVVFVGRGRKSGPALCFSGVH